MKRLSPVLGICLVLSVVVCAVLINSCHSGSDNPQVLTAAAQLRGDIDDDGQPSVGDAIGILRIVVGLDGANEAADADADGSTSVNDAIAVLRCVVGLAEWPLGEFRPPATRTIGPGVIVETDFTIGADDRVECLGDTTIQCETATIAGELYALPGAPGADGVDITIEADGDVVLTGELSAGDGGAGDPSGTGGDGGNGGSVTVNSANGDITIGAEVETTAGAPDSFLGAGDGGDGADGTLGGHGGDGGAVRIACLNGTLTFNQQPGLLHVGSGGDGGDATMTAAELEACGADVLRLQNGGGDGSVLIPSCDELVGVTLEDVGTDDEGHPYLVGVLDEGVGDGGDGGDAGDFTCVATAETSAWTAEVSTAVSHPSKTVEGDHGGNVSSGQAGKGESMTLDYSSDATADNAEGHSAVAIGGNGGHCIWEYTGGGVIKSWSAVIFGAYKMRSGDGGNATAKGGHGAAGSSCRGGTDGGTALAFAGNGGQVRVWDASIWDEDSIAVGKGGNAVATGGNGGPGGECCSPNIPNSSWGQGRTGAEGGLATAKGGHGGWSNAPSLEGPGGNATATGGNGGQGGMGEPGGSGGGCGTAPRCAAGKGDPDGTAVSDPGDRGETGATCPGSEIVPPDPDDTTGRTDPPNVPMRATKVSPTGSAVTAQGDDYETTSDAEGNYTFTGVEPGEYIIVPDGSVAATPYYWLPSIREVTKVEGEALIGMDFTRVEGAQYTVTVRVMDEDHDPVEGVDITLLAYSNRPDCFGVTGADGVAMIAGVWSGLYTVIVTPPAGLVSFPDTQQVMVTDANAWTVPLMLVEEE
ncbi:MAG TPA: hypothetical protein DGT21_16590 [Armatimonadetes bacterium]|nr:hypothetical protein [Armatimonadota bacterium]